MWSPWRSEYMGMAGTDQACFLCEAAADESSDKVLLRARESLVILNAFPYNTGHLMIAPYRHVGELEDMTGSERAEMMELTTASVTIVREAMRCHGFNLGMNLGTVAGAGVPGHAHMHVVPRWGGDTNFMPVLSDTKVLPELLEQTRAKLAPGFAALTDHR